MVHDFLPRRLKQFDKLHIIGHKLLRFGIHKEFDTFPNTYSQNLRLKRDLKF